MSDRQSARNAGRRARSIRRGSRSWRVAYVGRFATTRAKLAHYLLRKLREKGWEGARPPDDRGAGRAAGAARLCRRCGLSRCRRRGRWASAAMASGGSTRRCARPGSTRSDGAPAKALATRARRRRRSAMPSGAGWARSRPQAPDPQAARAGAGGDDSRRPRFRSRAAHHRPAARPGAIDIEALNQSFRM